MLAPSGSELNIMSAECGGFVVLAPGSYDVSRDRAIGRLLLFAGSLTDCLEFMRARLADLPPTASDVRKAV